MSAGQSTVSFAVSASDAQEGDISSLVTCNYGSGASFPLGSTQVSCSVTDCLGQTPSCSFDVKVEDTTPPAITCPNYQAVSCPASQTFSATATDACSTASELSVVCTPSNFFADTTDSVIATCTATDDVGLTSSCSFNFSVVDTIPPVLVVPPSITVPATSCAGAPITYTVNASDVCAFGELTCDFFNGTVAPSSCSNLEFPVGVTQITCTATNMAGLSSTGSFDVTVANQPPCIVCPANIVTQCVSNMQSPVSFSVMASDVQEGDISSLVTCDYASGASFGLGNTTVKCSVTDCLGSTVSCSFNIDVQDTASPNIECPCPSPTSCPVAQTFSAVASDACYGPGSLTVSCTPNSYAANDFAGLTNGLCSVTDPSGNHATCSFNYAVVDKTPPVLNVPACETIYATSCSGAPVTYCVNATDACELKSVVCVYASNGAPASLNGNKVEFPMGATTIVCTATNPEGLTTTGQFTITVVNSPPTLTCPANICTECVSNGQAGVTYSISASDPEDGNIDSLIVCSAPSGSSFPVGITTVTCSVSDCACGRASCSFTVDVQDTTPPNITYPNLPPTTCPSAQSFTATASDACYPHGLVASCTPSSYLATDFSGFSNGLCSVSDVGGNRASCSFSYVVQDNAPPVLNFPSSSSYVATSCAGAPCATW